MFYRAFVKQTQINPYDDYYGQYYFDHQIVFSEVFGCFVNYIRNYCVIYASDASAKKEKYSSNYVQVVFIYSCIKQGSTKHKGNTAQSSKEGTHSREIFSYILVFVMNQKIVHEPTHNEQCRITDGSQSKENKFRIMLCCHRNGSSRVRFLMSHLDRHNLNDNYRDSCSQCRKVRNEIRFKLSQRDHRHLFFERINYYYNQFLYIYIISYCVIGCYNLVSFLQSSQIHTIIFIIIIFIPLFYYD